MSGDDGGGDDLSLRPTWRSLLFVPANAPRRWEKAHLRDADAVIIDLEDSIQPEAKTEAREYVAPAIDHLSRQGMATLVRVNNEPHRIEGDLDAAVRAGLTAVMLPKASGPEQIQWLGQAIRRRERDRGLVSGQIGVLAVIEDPLALEAAGRIAACEGIVGLALGGEDFALALGRAPTPACLNLACSMTAYAARARGLMAIGMSCGIGNYTDLEEWSAHARNAYAMGMTGALAIHPDQIRPLNIAFGPTAADLREADDIVSAWEDRTSDVFSLNGRMIDQPVVERARRLLGQRSPK